MPGEDKCERFGHDFKNAIRRGQLCCVCPDCGKDITSYLVFKVGFKEQTALTVNAYCVRCRDTQEMKNFEIVTLEYNREALKGICLQCGGELFRTTDLILSEIGHSVIEKILSLKTEEEENC